MACLPFWGLILLSFKTRLKVEYASVNGRACNTSASNSLVIGNWRFLPFLVLVKNVAVYIMLGVSFEGRKEIIDFWVGEIMEKYEK